MKNRAAVKNNVIRKGPDYKSEGDMRRGTKTVRKRPAVIGAGHKSALLSQQPENQGQNDRYDDAGSQREIKNEIFSFNVDVSRQLAEPGDLPHKGNNDTGHDDYKPDNDKSFTKTRHDFSRNS